MVKFYENITQDTQHLVKELNNKMKNGKPCALTVYHPHCGHCMDMKPNWKAMGEHMEKNYDDDLYIAFIHMDVADEFPIDQYKIQGYPHIIYTANNNEVEYNGPREVDAFESWILENLKQTNNNNTNKNVNTTVLPNSDNYNSLISNKNNKNNNNISNITNNFNSSNESQNFENSSNSNVSSHPLNKAQNSLQLYRKLLDKYSRNKNSQMTSKAQPVNKIKSVKKKKTSQKPKMKLTKNKKLSKKSMTKTKKTKSVKKSKSMKTKSKKKTKSMKKPKSTKKSNTRKLKTFHDLNTL
jgi:thioredoxin-like negative regulator of GroEL